jgi:tRNA threonylcarbamoyladenosine biosynthesis protein TsaE
VPSADLDERALRAWGESFVRSLRLPACVTLSGELGAGKTTLVQSMVAALGVREAVTSPTYALVNEYDANGTPITHVDLYRLRDAGQLPQIGWHEMLATRGVLLVEWPERALEAMPPDAIALRLEHVPGDAAVRRLTWPT